MQITNTLTLETDPRNAAQRWLAQIELGFEYTGERTVLRRRSHCGPLRVQKPFYPEGGVCHVYLLHPPGGMAGQDQLAMGCHVAPGASALVTTPAANKVYRTAGLRSQVVQDLQVEDGGELEWLPQGTILFGRSDYQQTTAIRAGASARFCVWDISYLGRPASGDDYQQGQCAQTLQVVVNDTPIYIDRLNWAADDPLLDAHWGLAGHKVLSQLLMYPMDMDGLQRARQILRPYSGAAAGHAAATLVDDLLVIRVVGDIGYRVQALLTECWRQLRPLVMGRPACTPRIWAT